MLKKTLITLITTITITVPLLHNSMVATATDKLSEYDIKVNNTITTCYRNLTTKQLDYFKVEGYHIQILKEGENICDMEQYSDNTDATGLIDYEDNMIYIKYFHDTELMKMNLYHELGHMLDESNNFISETSDFNFIWNDRDAFFSCFSYPTDYFKSSRRECFAQMYSVYKQFPEWMCENYGYIYNYFLVLETNAPTE